MVRVPRIKPGFLMQVFGGMDAKTITMLLMGLMGLAGGGAALKGTADNAEDIELVVATSDSLALDNTGLRATVDSLVVVVRRLEDRLGKAQVTYRQVIRQRRAAREPVWKVWKWFR